MDVQFQPTLLGSICEGCLSIDRKLSPIIKDESQRFFGEILDPLDQLNSPFLLCWECLALTNRFVKFKQQVKFAHDLLVKYMTHQTQKLPTLTSLSITTNKNTYFESQHEVLNNDNDILFPFVHNNEAKRNITCNVTFKDIISENSVRCNENKNLLNDEITVSNNYDKYEASTHSKLNNTVSHGPFNKRTNFNEIENDIIESHNQMVNVPLLRKEERLLTTEEDIEHSLPCCSISYVTSISKTEENAYKNVELKCTENDDNRLSFIKTEADGDNEGIFIDDASFVDADNDSDIKQVLISEEIKNENQSHTSKIKTKRKRKKKKIVTEKFDESDDEPLKKVKETKDQVHKPRGRRKKKENEEQKQGGHNNSRARREKPPGVVYNARVERKLRQLNVASGSLEMVVLSWEQVEEERERALASDTFTRHEYKCYDCVVGFNHRAKLDNHMLKHDPSAGEMVCSVCRVRCQNKHSLCAHRRRHRVRWRCCICQAVSSRASVSADHLAREHGQLAENTHTHTCRLCGHTEPTLGKLRNHMKSHAERQKCELCGKTFRDRTSLRTHLFIHKGEKEYSCPKCDKKFLFKKAMEVHMVTHNDSEHLYCYECDMNFKNQMSYYQHMKYNLKHIDPAKLKFACQLCDKKFAKAARLEEHNIAVHLKATPIRCTMEGCSFACASRPVLRTHIRMIHRNMRAVRNHVCHNCGKAYTTKKSLERHLRSHTGKTYSKNKVFL